MMCASLIPHLASAFHRTCQVSQLHLPSMPMRQSIENALQTGELARSLFIRCACSGACRRTGGWSRERALAWSARTHATAAACPPSKPCQSPTEVQRPNSSLGHTCGWLWAGPAVGRLWYPRSPAVSTARFSLLTAGLPIRLPLQAGWRSLLVSKTFPIVLKGAL